MNDIKKVGKSDVYPATSIMQLRRLGIYCGIVAPLLWLTMIGLSGVLQPEYSHLSQYISELGATGSNTELLMRYAGFLLTGFLYVLFALALWPIFDQPHLRVVIILIGLDGIGRMGAGIYPCEPGCVGTSLSQQLHHDFASLGFLSGCWAAVVSGMIFRNRYWPRYLSGCFLSCGLLALVSLGLMIWPENPIQAPGLFELVATTLLSLWLFMFALSCLQLINAHK